MAMSKYESHINYLFLNFIFSYPKKKRKKSQFQSIQRIYGKADTPNLCFLFIYSSYALKLISW